MDKINIIDNELCDNKYLHKKNVEISKSTFFNLNKLINFKKYRINDIFWYYTDINYDLIYNNININIDIEYEKYTSKNYISIQPISFLELDMEKNDYYTNRTHHKYLKYNYENVFYENFSYLDNVKNISIDFDCDTNIELLIFYEDIFDNLQSNNYKDFFYINW
jgi:hypothetical protein